MLHMIMSSTSQGRLGHVEQKLDENCSLGWRWEHARKIELEPSATEESALSGSHRKRVQLKCDVIAFK